MTDKSISAPAPVSVVLQTNQPKPSASKRTTTLGVETLAFRLDVHREVLSATTVKDRVVYSGASLGGDNVVVLGARKPEPVAPVMINLQQMYDRLVAAEETIRQLKIDNSTTTASREHKLATTDRAAVVEFNMADKALLCDIDDALDNPSVTSTEAAFLRQMRVKVQREHSRSIKQEAWMHAILRRYTAVASRA